MRAAWLLGALGLGAPAALAQGKTCEELVVEIAAKMDAAGVKGYNLEVLPAALVGEAKVVGSCERGSKKVTYDRGAPPAKAAARPAAAASGPASRKP